MAMSTRSTAIRVFVSLWIIFSVHWATDFVREHFLVLSIVERHTFALDGFEDLHPDIFVHIDGHSYHGANPGISMVGAIPYFVLSPIVDRIAERELASRPPGGGEEPEYNDPRRARREFYAEVRARGLDVRFGLIGLVTQVFANAPLSALGGSVFFLVLIGAGLSRRTALGGTLLYAVGTPVFMRSAYLNQNLAVGIFGFLAFALLWNPGTWCGWSRRVRYALAGACAGLALLSDYSGGLILALLGLYVLLRQLDEDRWPEAIRSSLWYVAGSVPPVLVLWYYQWSAFGFPFYPPQHYMPPVEWSDLGYQGVAGPSPDLAWMLLIDPRFGLLVNTPVIILALGAPFLAARGSFLPRRESLLMCAVGVLFLLFFSSVHYTRLQYITGIRYMVPVIPFLVLAAIPLLLRLPRALTYGIVVVSVIINWGLAMGRPLNDEGSIVESLARIYLGGFQLPALNTLSRMSASYVPGASSFSAGVVLVVTGIVLYAVWTVKRPWRGLVNDEGEIAR
jgi:hypothetical protein